MSTIYTGLTATGTTQGTALALASGGTYYQVTTTSASADAVILPASQTPGSICQVQNLGTTSLVVFPPVGGTIAGGATNAADAVPIVTGATTIYETADGTNWVYVPAGTSAPGGSSKRITVAANTTLTAAESGASVLITPGSAITITLPAATAGLKFRFWQAAASGSGDVVIQCPGGLTLLQGSVLGAGTVVAIAGHNLVTFVHTASVIGDCVEVECDGTHWLIKGWGAAIGAFTSAS